MDMEKGSVPDTLVNACMQRTRALHIGTGWRVNMIHQNGQLWGLLYAEEHRALSSRDALWVTQVLIHPNIGAAHKADVFRYFLLKYYGGVWLDASTVLIETCEWVTSTGAELVIPFIPVDQFVQMAVKPSSERLDSLRYSDYDTWLQTTFYNSIAWGSMTKHLQFTPENWFVGSTIANPVIVDTLNMLRVFWTRNVLHHKRLLTRVGVNGQIRKHIAKLMYGTSKIFTCKKTVYVILIPNKCGVMDIFSTTHSCTLHYIGTLIQAIAMSVCRNHPMQAW